MRLRHLLLLTQLPFWGLLLIAFLNLQAGLDRRVQALSHADQTRTQLEAVNALLTHAVDMETGVRGYVITKQTTFLEPYYRAEAAYPAVINALQNSELTGTDRAHLTRIQSTVQRWQTEVAQPEIRARTDRPGEADALLRSGQGKRLLDQVRAEVNALSEDLTGRLQQDNVHAQRELSSLERDLALAAALLLLLSLGTTLTTARLLSLPLSELGQGARRVTDTGGAVAVAERGPREFRELAATFNEMAGGVRDARRASDVAASELARRNTWLKELAQLSDALQAARNLGEATEILQRALPHLLPGTGGQLLHNASRNLLLPVTHWGAPFTAPGPDTCWALRRGETQGEAQERPFMPGCAVPDEHYLCAPLFSHGETLGLLRMQGQDDLPAPRAALNDVARQVALALASLRLQDRLLQQSIRDPLTGLYNRRHLEAQLSAAVATAHGTHAPLSVVALDIDHFKRLNDTFGHDAGDAALIRVSAALRDLAPPGSTPARPGGEEFTLLLPQFDLTAAQALAERLRAQVAALHLTHDGLPLGQVTVSLGVASLTEGGTGEGLIAAADQALYAAKRAGRNRVST